MPRPTTSTAALPDVPQRWGSERPVASAYVSACSGVIESMKSSCHETTPSCINVWKHELTFWGQVQIGIGWRQGAVLELLAFSILSVVDVQRDSDWDDSVILPRMAGYSGVGFGVILRGG